jgi:hypothetical protein
MPVWHLPPVWQGTGPEPEAGADLGHNDYDTLPNWYEQLIGTSPYNPDTDGDLILDSDELTSGWTDYDDW